MTSPRDKRLFPRRATVPVPIMLSHAGGADLPGSVLDYSPSGLTIQANVAVPADTVLRVHCVRAGGEPLEVRVVRCSAQDGGWQLGCRFDTPRHWDDLWMFGTE